MLVTCGYQGLNPDWRLIWGKAETLSNELPMELKLWWHQFHFERGKLFTWKFYIWCMCHLIHIYILNRWLSFRMRQRWSLAIALLMLWESCTLSWSSDWVSIRIVEEWHVIGLDSCIMPMLIHFITGQVSLLSVPAFCCS